MMKEQQNNRASAQQTEDNTHSTIQSSSPYLGEGQERKMGFFQSPSRLFQVYGHGRMA